MKYSNDFEIAFDITMQFEVGPSFDPSNPDVQDGLIETREQKRAVGYVNHKDDPGGETKFGIAQKFNQDVSVVDLTLEEAKEIYFDKYWTLTNCGRVTSPVNILYFDAIVNHGTKRATKFLQLAAGATPDGAFGPMTLAAVRRADEQEICEAYLDEREAFYYRLVEKRPNMSVFLKGWLRRVDSLRAQFV